MPRKMEKQQINQATETLERLVERPTAGSDPEVHAMATLMLAAGKRITPQKLVAWIAAVGTLSGGAGFLGAGQIARAETEKVAQEAVAEELAPIRADVKWLKDSVRAAHSERAADRRMLCKAAGIDPDSPQCARIQALPPEPEK